jgi:outer membrane protein assembly factor BamB
MKRILFSLTISLILVSPAGAQRGGQEWLTSNADAQRSSWIRVDSKISRESMQKTGSKLGFQFLWKMKLDNGTKQLNSLTQPVLLDRLIGYLGFKSLAFVGASSDSVYAVDVDLARIYWKASLTPAPSPASGASLQCPGGLTAAATRTTGLVPPLPGRGGGARINSARSMVGEPDQGYPDLFGRGAGGAGRGAAPTPAAPAPAPAAAPATPPAPAGGGGGGGFGGAGSVYVLGSDGMLHQLSIQTGRDIVIHPLRLLPPNANASALIVVNNVLHTATTNGCGDVPNGVWAVDLGSPDKTITNWKTDGPNIAGAVAPAIGTDGTVYVATSDELQSPSTYANSVVALESKTLKLKDYFTQPKADFSTSPLVFQHRGKDLIAAGGKDGRLYILNSTSLGGVDHRTPLSGASLPAAGDFAQGNLASWEDTDGTRWILTATSNAIAAFQVVEQDGVPALQRGWTSREMVSPLPPIVVNGVVFALSSGAYRAGARSMTAAQRAQRSRPAVLYALEGTTGKELWNSGTTITSFVHSAGLSGGLGQIYVGTYDNTLYAFGFPIEK